jgi:uncharacterized metal-binding protein
MSEQKNGCPTTGSGAGDTCCGSGVTTLVVACSGGSNAGQVSNNIMIELDRKDLGNAYCLAGIGAALPGFIESAKAARTIVIDGCPTGCAKKAFEKYSIEPSLYFIVTDLGVTKVHNFDKLSEETDIAMNAILEKL